MRRLFYAAVAMVALAGFTADHASAQSLDLDSSMQAQCLGGSCQFVQFTLNVVGNVFIDIVRIFSGDGTVWQFGALTQVIDGGGNDVTSGFLSSVSANQLQITSLAVSPTLVSEPLSLTIQMATWGSTNQLWPNLSYTANGEVALPPDGTDFFSTQGVVTPEPSTVLLLGTGLLGLTGMAWRRRKGSDLEA